MDETDICPKCHGSAAVVVNIVFHVSACGHLICDNCYRAIYDKGEACCISCDQNLSKDEFRVKKFKCNEVEQYLYHQNIVKKIYNKAREDFTTLLDYNNYMEKVETIIYDLVDPGTREASREKIRLQQVKHKNDIKTRRNRKDPEIEELLEWERKDQDNRKTVEADLLRLRTNVEAYSREYARKLVNAAGTAESEDQVHQWFVKKVEDEKKRVLQEMEVDSQHVLGDNKGPEIKIPYTYCTSSRLDWGQLEAESSPFKSSFLDLQVPCLDGAFTVGLLIRSLRVI